MQKTLPWLLLCSFPAMAAPIELNKQTIYADFRKSSVQDLSEATTLISNEQIQARSAEHLEQVLSFAPNVNFASGSSRARFFQIRGIGEESQFIDPVNPSIGLMVDGIDMTGLGSAAALFDVEQVEILRGPQGTRFGANSLGGLINIQSAAPTKETTGYLSGKVGNYHSYGLGGALSGSLADNLQGRLAVQQFQSNGYMRNDFLGRKDTNELNETLVRGRLNWQPDAQSELKLVYFFADMDNGYDAFTLDNSRHSLADEPGRDKQRTHALALSWQQRFGQVATLESTLAGSHSKTDYHFDLDWVYPSFDAGTYSGFDAYWRTYKRASLDLRLLSGQEGRIFAGSTDWVLGVYALERNEQLSRDIDDGSGAGIEHASNELDASSVAIYAELNTQFDADTRLIYGFRAENWRNEFTSSAGVNANTDEWLAGGKVTLEHWLTLNQLSYASYAYGYKPGGVNSDPDVSLDNRQFGKETNHTYELGLKSSWLAERWQTRLAAFYISRENQQVKSSYAYGQPVQFQDYTANAAKGESYGLELESRWQLNTWLAWDLTYGYLRASFKDYAYVTDDGWVDKTGRAQLHSPKHSGATAFTFQPTESLSLRLEAEGKTSFYFEDSQDAQSHAYMLYHARLSYTQPRYEVALSGRNLANKDYATRGYSGFNNNPKDNYDGDKAYVQLGEPRLVMLEGRFNF